MFLHKLLWLGAVYIAGREVIHFFREAQGSGSSPPEPLRSAPERGGEDADAEALADAEAEEIQAANHTLVFTLAGLTTATFGALLHPRLPFLTVPLLIVGMFPPARRAWRESQATGRVTYSGLEILQGVSELAVGQVFLTAGGWILFSGGKRLLLATRRGARAELAASVAAETAGAWVLCDGVEVLKAVEQIQAGDRLVVRAGDLIPVDGRVVEGVLGVDQRALTGESVLKEVAEGDEVFASTSVLSGQAVIVAERTGQETVMSRVEALLANASSYEQRLTARVTAVTERSVRPTVALAAYGLVTQGPIGVVAGLWTNALDMAWMSAPYSMLNTIRAAARAGILIKDGRSLELLSRVDTVVFDKTGTLTLDTLEVVAVDAAGGHDADAVLGLSAALEQFQSHPIAEAIVRAARRAGLALPGTEGRRVEIGYGVRGRAGGHELILGSARLMAREGITSVEEGAIRGEATQPGHSLVHLAVDGVYAGRIVLAPQIRPDVHSLLDELRRRCITVMIVSGDEEAPTRALAEELGVADYVARALPEDKARVIAELQGRGRVVCFVGDGINDALAMNRAQVSVSLAGASSMAVENAQIILRAGAIGALGPLLQLGRDFAVDQETIMGSSLTITALNSFGFLFAGYNIITLVGLYAAGVGINFVTSLRPHFRRYDHTEADASGERA